MFVRSWGCCGFVGGWDGWRKVKKLLRWVKSMRHGMVMVMVMDLFGRKIELVR